MTALLLAVAVLVETPGCAGVDPYAGSDGRPPVYELPPIRAAERMLSWGRGDRDKAVGILGGDSMLPFMRPSDYVLMVRYVGQPLWAHEVVRFNRGDADDVTHEILEVRRDAVYMAGLHNGAADGWFPKSSISWVVVEVVRPTGPVSLPAVPNQG